MAVTNVHLMAELHSIKESYEDKILKLNKYLIGRCLYFEEQNNILKAESIAMKKEFDNLLMRFDGVCEEISNTRMETNTLKTECGKNESETVKTIDMDSMTVTENSNITSDSNFSKLDTKITNICVDVNTVKEDINSMKQINMSNDIVITGVYEEEDENLFELVSSILIQYNIPVKKEDIKTMYRLKNKKCDHNTPILLVLKESLIKCSILESQKKYGPILLRSVIKSLHETDLRKVIFKHRLTKENLSLLRESRRFGRQNNFEFVWTNGNTVLMKKCTDARTIEVVSAKALLMLSNYYGNG